MARQLFWLVWGENTLSVTNKHLNRGSAEAEALRLAEQNPGGNFFVVEPVVRFRKVSVEREEFDDGIPF
jgi:hypothetical protein